MISVDVRELAGLDSGLRKSSQGGLDAEGGRDAASGSSSVPVTIEKRDISVPGIDEAEEYADLCAIVAGDPDAEPPARYRELVRKFATQGAQVGYRNGGPVFVSVGRSFMEQATSGAQIGVDHAG